MSLQFVDFDGDGQEDLLAATYEGTVFLVRGTQDGWLKPTHVLDKQGRPVLLSLYYDTLEHTYKNAERSLGPAKNPEDHCIAVSAVDWDADGDLDLLLSSYEGRLYLQLNEGERGVAAFSGTNRLLKAGGKSIDLDGGLTAARPVDWNGDGLFDLLCGSFDGSAIVFLNCGERGAPVFAGGLELLKSAGEGGSDGSAPTSDFYVDAVDYDGDGDLDLLVGGHYEFVPPERELTVAEVQQLVELDAEAERNDRRFRELQRISSERGQGLSSEDVNRLHKELFAEPANVKFMTRRSEVFREIEVLRPRRRKIAGVWLYRQIS
ncbi:MAG: hypothetical protein ACI9F9_002184 [Candidatus Paceibacteria bacterium]|jgi:hypothetical protein